MNTQTYGLMNGHAVGILMKEITRRAMESVWNNRAQFEAEEKVSYKREQDFVTTADYAAQVIFEKSLKECFPTFGIIGEENSLQIECTEPGVDGWFTVDPLDGTKAFIRRQSHGVGSMLGLVYNGTIIAAVVGDVMTHEMYYFRPESPQVHRLNLRDDRYETLRIDPKRRLVDQYVLLRDDPREHSSATQKLTLRAKGHKGLFKNIEVAGGSIGIHMARLWKSEVGGVILQAGPQTPWDLIPVLGISQQLGFVWCARDSVWVWREQKITPAKTVCTTEDEVLVIHKSRFSELDEWQRR